MSTYKHDSSGNLFDEIMNKFSLKNDAALAEMLYVRAPVISKIRHGKMPVGASLIIKAHEATGWSIQTLKGLLLARKDSEAAK